MKKIILKKNDEINVEKKREKIEKLEKKNLIKIYLIV